MARGISTMRVTARPAHLLIGAFSGAFWLAAATTASAQGSTPSDWPTRNIRLVVSFAAGGPADLVAREVGLRMSDDLGKSIIVENQGGGGGKPAVLTVARADADGYTLLFTPSGSVVHQPLVDRDSSAVERLAPVGLVSTSPHVLVVYPKLPAQNIKELVDYARANPGQVNFGSAGTGAAAHLGMEMLKSTAKIDIVHVPYRGTSQAVLDLLAGRIQAMFSSMPSLKGMIDDGSLRAIGMTDKSRVDAGLPVISDTIPTFGYTTWYGMFAPVKTPPAVIDRLSASLRKTLADKALQDKLAVQGLDLQFSTPAELAAYVKADIQKWAPIIEAADLRSK